MPTAAEVWNYMQTLAPAELAESWDNVGPLVDCGNCAERILVGLDITPETVEEARERGCGMIVAHHPVIFRPLKRLAAGQAPFMLVQNGISAVCAHTNLDAAEGGVNDVLAGLFGLENVQPLAGLGRVGGIEPVSAAELAQKAARLLGAHCRLADTGRPVRRLAVVGGSGGDFALAAAEAGADCLLTGEAGHHHALDALNAGISVIEAGHFATEQPVVGLLAQLLGEKFPQAEVLVCRTGRDPFGFFC